MWISELDSNFKIESNLSEKDIVWKDAKENVFVKYGIAQTDGDYLRMPKEVSKKVSDGVAGLSTNTSGVRIRLCTDSPYIAIKAVFPNLDRLPHMPLTGTSGFDLYKEVCGHQYFVCAYIPPLDSDNGFECLMNTENPDGKLLNFIINFPPYNAVDKVYIGLKEGSTLETPDKYVNEKPIVFYGSSITQGGCASRPGNIYQNFLSRALNMDYLSLGFSGNAKGEKEIADYMARIPMSAFVSDYDHNAPNSEHLKKTHFSLYQTIRDKNPEIPYIMVTHPSKGINEPIIRRKIIMESYIKALDCGDRNVYFIDGDSLFACREFDSCTVDGCHPNDLGFYLMAQGMYPILKNILFFG